MNTTETSMHDATVAELAAMAERMYRALLDNGNVVEAEQLAVIVDRHGRVRVSTHASLGVSSDTTSPIFRALNIDTDNVPLAGNPNYPQGGE